jgi:hypothetical protein
MIYDSKPVSNFKLLQVLTTNNSNSTNYQFPDQPELRDRKVEKISMYNTSLIGTTPNNITPVSQTITTQCFLVLYVNEREDIKIPLSSLVNTIGLAGGALYSSVNGYIPLDDIKIVWSKSYIKNPKGTVITGNQGFIFGVFYK